MNDKIDEILSQRRSTAPPADEEEKEGDKFYSVLLGEGMQENFIELQFRNGLQTCFSYTDLLWFNLDPERGYIDLEIGGYQIAIKGRGLKPIFNGVKSKRIAWVKEATSELQDHKDNECFVEEITITPPEGYAEEAEEQ